MKRIAAALFAFALCASPAFAKDVLVECPSGDHGAYFALPPSSPVAPAEQFQLAEGTFTDLDGNDVSRGANEVLSDALVLFCSSDPGIAVFEGDHGIVSYSKAVGSEISLGRNGGGTIVAVRFDDLGTVGSEGGVAGQLRFACPENDLRGLPALELVNVAVYSPGLDTGAISSSAAWRNQYLTWVRDRAKTMATVFMDRRGCSAISQTEFGTRVTRGDDFVVRYIQQDPGVMYIEMEN
ncbi:MAG: hypothetical protein HYV63_19465 [Candidatus Schekmanbacteria bacterium]|nr:hypothetical protein [Candidatus Schekmanbacteria bacterium]